MSRPPDSKLPAALRWLFPQEGGFVDHPKDPGGPTNLGISLRAVRRLDADGALAGYLRDALDVDDDGDIDRDDVKGWTTEIAAEFYRRFYWEPARCDELPWPVALIVFDSAVLEGKTVAIGHLQRAMGFGPKDIDGAPGPKTLAAAARQAAAVGDYLLKQTIVLRLDRFRQLHNAATFFGGWASRMLDLHVEVLKEVA